MNPFPSILGTLFLSLGSVIAITGADNALGGGMVAIAGGITLAGSSLAEGLASRGASK